MIEEEATSGLIEMNSAAVRLEVFVIEDAEGEHAKCEGLDEGWTKGLHEVENEGMAVVGGFVEAAGCGIETSIEGSGEDFTVNEGGGEGDDGVDRV